MLNRRDIITLAGLATLIAAVLVVVAAVFSSSGPRNGLGPWPHQPVASRCVGVVGPCLPADESAVLIVDGVLCSAAALDAEVLISWVFTDARGTSFATFLDVAQPQVPGCVIYSDAGGDQPSFRNPLDQRVIALSGEPSQWFVRVVATPLDGSIPVVTRTDDVLILPGGVAGPPSHAECRTDPPGCG